MTVEGEREVLRAFDKLSDSLDNLSDANAEVAEKLIGDVRKNTRRKTGTLASAWIGSGEATAAQFSNPTSYAVIQEFGGRSIEPTNAVARAFEGNKDAIQGTYSDAIERRAKRADITTSH
jgi:hypothetical protein